MSAPRWRSPARPCTCTGLFARDGLGLAQPDALANTAALRAHLRMLDETAKVFDVLVELLHDVPCAGKQVHDANLVATALAHGVDTIATLNVNDLARFDARIRVVDLART